MALLHVLLLMNDNEILLNSKNNVKIKILNNRHQVDPNLLITCEQYSCKTGR